MATSIRSPYPDVEIPDVPLTPFVYAEAAVPRRPDRDRLRRRRDARTPTRCSTTWSAAAPPGLVERGLKPHEVVGIFAPNLPEYPIAFHGVAQAGGDNTTVNSLYNAQELGFQLKNARRAVPDHDPAVPRPRAAGRRRGAGSRRSTCSARRRARRRSRRCSPTGAPAPEPEIDCAHDLVVAAVLERHDGAAQGRDADAPQPGREHGAVRRLPRRRPGRSRDRRSCRSSTSTARRSC